MAWANMLGTGILVALLMLPGKPGRAETWCIRDAGSPGPGACVFPSAQDCGRAATLNPFGGICERQPLGLNNGAEDGDPAQAFAPVMNLRRAWRQPAASSIAAMSSSERPKWWPISCTSTWVMIVPSASSCSAQ